MAMLWLPTEVGRLLARSIGVEDDAVRSDVPHHPEIWGDLCGWYANPAKVTDIRAQLMVGAGAEVFTRGDRLFIRLLSPLPVLYRGFELHPDEVADPDVFRVDLTEFGLPIARIIFSRRPGRPASAVHLDIFPVSLRRRPSRTNPRLWVQSGLAGVGVALAAVALRRRRAVRARP